jgi:phosphoglycolate phosphatase-like HAD superfamily hydrolase
MIKLKDMISRSLFTESKKLRVFDFDDTLVKTTSFIYVTNNGKKSKLTPGEYAVYNENLISQISLKYKTHKNSRKSPKYSVE